MFCDLSCHRNKIKRVKHEDKHERFENSDNVQNDDSDCEGQPSANAAAKLTLI